MKQPPTQAIETLLKAIADADIEAVRKLLNHDRALVNATWLSQGLTPLHIACGLYARESRKADFSAKHQAREFEAICQELIYFGALPTTKTSTGKAITDLTDGRVPPCVRTWFKAQAILGRFDEELRETGLKRQGTRGFERNFKQPSVSPNVAVAVDEFDKEPSPIAFARLKPDFFPSDDEEDSDRDYAFGNPLLASVEREASVLSDERPLTVPRKRRAIGSDRRVKGWYAN